MNGSYIAQIFQYRKLNALAHTIHKNIHIYIHVIHTWKTWCAQICGTAYWKREVLNWALKSDSMAILHKLPCKIFTLQSNSRGDNCYFCCSHEYHWVWTHRISSQNELTALRRVDQHMGISQICYWRKVTTTKGDNPYCATIRKW